MSNRQRMNTLLKTVKKEGLIYFSRSVYKHILKFADDIEKFDDEKTVFEASIYLSPVSVEEDGVMKASKNQAYVLKVLNLCNSKSVYYVNIKNGNRNIPYMARFSKYCYPHINVKPIENQETVSEVCEIFDNFEVMTEK